MVAENVRRIVAEQGRTQKWIVEQINEIAPELKMDTVKFSAIITGIRNISADEMLAFCKALKISPDELVDFT